MTTTVAMIDPLRSAGPLMVWLIVLGFVYAECAFVVGMFLPGDSLLLAAGVVLADHDRVFDAWALSVCTAMVAVAGNHTGYAIGQRTSSRLLARKNGRMLNRRNFDRAGRFFRHWGFWAVVAARWLPFVRTIAPMFAGAARMDPRRFFLASVVGALGWAPLLVLLGYYGSGLLDYHPWLRPLATAALIALVAAGTTFGLWHYRQEMRKPVDEDATLVSALRE